MNSIANSKITKQRVILISQQEVKWNHQKQFNSKGDRKRRKGEQRMEEQIENK